MSGRAKHLETWSEFRKRMDDERQTFFQKAVNSDDSKTIAAENIGMNRGQFLREIRTRGLIRGRAIVTPTHVLDALRNAASDRGITVDDLVRRIVEIVAIENMVDAVLDDTPKGGSND